VLRTPLFPIGFFTTETRRPRRIFGPDSHVCPCERSAAIPDPPGHEPRATTLPPAPTHPRFYAPTRMAFIALRIPAGTPPLRPTGPHASEKVPDTVAFRRESVASRFTMHAFASDKPRLLIRRLHRFSPIGMRDNTATWIDLKRADVPIRVGGSAPCPDG